MELELHVGVDEAGRGAVVGPLVVYTVAVLHPLIPSLQGVQDSKKLTREERAYFSKLIKRFCIYSYTIATPPCIDTHVEDQKLNALERKLALSAEANLVKNLGSFKANIKRVRYDGKSIFEELTYSWMGIAEAVDKADALFPEVSCASVCAKHHRDVIVQQIMGPHFNKGAGYPNEHTAKWLKDHNYSQEVLEHVRKSWKWYKKLTGEIK